MLQTMSIPTILFPYFLYYTDGLSLFYAATSIAMALLSDRGNRYGYVVFSALFTLLAISVRQTNVILTILNPATILMLRVMHCCFLSSSTACSTSRRSTARSEPRSCTCSR